jgi:hypothetical protein
MRAARTRYFPNGPGSVLRTSRKYDIMAEFIPRGGKAVVLCSRG